jgi:WD40 repeat protein
MNKAYNLIEYSYPIKLIGHTDDILCFDICIPTNQAATGSKDKSIILWDLKNLQPIDTIKNKNNPVNLICFNHNGTHFSAVTHRPDDNISILQEWTTQPVKRLKSLQISGLIDYIDYLIPTHTQNNTLRSLCLMFTYNLGQNTAIIIHKNETQWQAEKFPLCFSHPIGQKAFSITHPLKTVSPKILQFNKEKCHTLGFCKLAIKNSPLPLTSLKKIENSQSYAQLTDYEKAIIQTQIQKKTNTRKTK